MTTTEAIATKAHATSTTGQNYINFVQIDACTLHLGDCLQVLRTIPANSVDSIVTDPPYGLSFMGKKWDYDVPGVEVWAECLRVLKPGGHLLAFAGTRTQHRMAVRIEDAGFEIRDMIAWVYGSGFPKSLDVSKAIDKAAGAEREVIGVARRSQVVSDGWDRPWKQEAMKNSNSTVAEFDITTPAIESARQWQGWGTALKPSLEPITMARKPLAGTVANNVMTHGTGALNIDGCRVPTDDGSNRARPPRTPNAILGGGNGTNLTESDHNEEGRWPANLIHDGSGEILSYFPDAVGQQAITSDVQRTKANVYGATSDTGKIYEPRTDSSNSAARFFYVAKASSEDRNEGCSGLQKMPGGSNSKGYTKDVEKGVDRNAPVANFHPTVKPTDLMRYLLRLVTPPHGIALDPFMGSGSTGKAAVLEDFKFIGIERDPAYFEIAKARIAAASAQSSLFSPAD